MRSHLSPTLRSRYDYYYSTLSPASSAANFYENQHLSLFGDPVPPATDFLETLDNHLYGRFRRRSSFGESPAGGGVVGGGAGLVLPSLSSASTQSRTAHHQPPQQHSQRHHQHHHHVALSPQPSHHHPHSHHPYGPPLQFSPPNTAYHVLDERLQPAQHTRSAGGGGGRQRAGSSMATGATSTTTTTSSGESSAGAQRRRPSGMSQQSATMTTFGRVESGGQQHQQQHHLQMRRGTGSYEKEFDVNLDFRISNEVHLPPVPPKRIFAPTEPHEYTNHNRSAAVAHRVDSSSTTSASYITHLASAEPNLKTFSPNNWLPQQLSDSSSSGRPLPPVPPNVRSVSQMSYNQQRQSHVPRASFNRNVTEITHGGGGGDSSDSGVCGGPRHGGGDAMTAVIADSTTSASSSGEERPSSASPPPPPLPPSQPPPVTDSVVSCSAGSTRMRVSASIDIEPYQVLPYDAHRMNPNPPSTTTTTNGSGSALTKSSTAADSGSEAICDSALPVVGRVAHKQEMSPTVFKDTIRTGGYRINQPRQHKKSSFAIINEFTVGQSRSHSPAGSAGRTSPFRGKGFRPPPPPPTTSSTAATLQIMQQQHLTVDPTDAYDPIARPGTVQFNASIAGSTDGGTGTESGTLTTTTMTTTGGDGSGTATETQSYEIRTDLNKHKTLIQIHHHHQPLAVDKPFAVLPPTAAADRPSLAPRHRFYASTGDLSPAAVNPRSTQRGLLRIVSGESATGPASKIPRRKSITASQEHLMLTRGGPASRRSSISPGRRGSTVGGATAAGRGHPHGVQPHAPIDLGMMMTAAGSRSANVSRSNSRISKPTTLSPIIGTPNKDSEQEDSGAGGSPMRRTAADAAVINIMTTSPTKIPVRSGSSTNLLARANSTATSRTASREPSPGAAGAAGALRKPVVRSGSNRSATNVRTTPASAAAAATAGRTKPTTASANRGRSSIRKSVGKTTPATGKSPATTKPDSTTTKPAKKTDSMRRPATVKREPSAVRREPSNLRREASNLKPDASTAAAKLKRENSSLRKKTDSAGVAPPKRQGSKLALPSPLAKNKSDLHLNKRLDKSGSFTTDKRRTTSESEGMESSDPTEKLVPLTKPNVVSMTTAAITAQPLAITTAVTNQTTGGGGDSEATSAAANASEPAAQPPPVISATVPDAKAAEPAPQPQQSPAQILEHSQKALECIQKTMLDATDEITRTIEGNLTDLKSLEHDMRIGAEPGSTAALQKPAPAMLEKKTSTRSLVRAALDDVAEVAEGGGGESQSKGMHGGGVETVAIVHRSGEGDDDGAGMGAGVTVAEGADGGHGDGAGNGKEGSDNGDADSTQSATAAQPPPSKCCPPCSKCCTPCFSFLCLPCTKLGATACCRRCRRRPDDKTTDDSADEVADAKAAVQTAEASPETAAASKNPFCACCRRKRSDSQTEDEIAAATAAAEMAPPKEPGKCALCISKFLCCKRPNKVREQTAHGDEEAGVASPARRKCCWCIPCGRKRPANEAWTDRRESILSEPEKRGCCARLCDRLLCCCRRREPSESRRPSMHSKKQSIAPTLPPEDTRPKLDEALIEHTSMMKAAIPVLPLCLAWFCLVCNCFVPGLGTILSGLFCLCIGVPRFSQHDGARARLGSFVINCIVGVSQMFCLLFCLVGWGWSIWWGTIMLRLARKRRQLKQDAIDAEAQQEEQTTSSNRTVMPPPMRSMSPRDSTASGTAADDTSASTPAAAPPPATAAAAAT